MPTRTETKHERFQRLAEKRLERTLEDFRLLSQLASTNYKNTPEEAFDLIRKLDSGLKDVARVFDVHFKSAVGNPRKLGPYTGQMNPIDVAKAIDLIDAGDPEKAKQQLTAALAALPR